jgi:outer membrane protein OmpA-like peptidoglycan-associated protein
MMKLAARLLWTLILLFVAGTSSVLAEEGYNAQVFWPSIFGGNYVAIEDASVLCPLGFHAGMLMNYANGPVQMTVGDSEDAGILNQLFTADVLAAFSPTSWSGVGVDIPIHLYTRARTFGDLEGGQDMSDLSSETKLGDIRAEIKFEALDITEYYVGLAFAPYATFPTGDPELFLGEGRVTGGGNVILEGDLQVFNLVLNGGYLYRGDAEILDTNIGNAWKLGAGLSRSFANHLSFSVEYFGSWVDSGSIERVEANPMEILGTLRFDFGENLPRVIGGASAGLTKGIGCPAYRLIGGVDYTYCSRPPENGLLDIKVVDQDDAPLVADLELFGPTSRQITTDANGGWNSEVLLGDYKITASKNGYDSASTNAVVAPEETASVKLQLNKKQAVVKVITTDKCTGEKLASSVAISGDKTYALPLGEKEIELLPGTYTLTASAEEYEGKKLTVDVTPGTTIEGALALYKKIQKTGKVYFAVNSAVIKSKSYPVLNDVADQIKSLCEFKKIIIEGHTSSEGSDTYNMKLSKRRATSVREYLIKKGIDASKLEIAAHGEIHPIASNATKEGRSQNRRVEFIIQ